MIQVWSEGYFACTSSKAPLPWDRKNIAKLLILSTNVVKRYRPSPSLEFVRVGGETVQPSSSFRNLGVILDPSADRDHIKKICKTCHFHLTNISKIRTYLDHGSTEAILFNMLS